MLRWRMIKVVSIAVISVLAGACAAPRSRAVNSAVRRFQAVDKPAIFDAAQTALRDLGYIIDRQDASTGVLTTRPILDSPDDRRPHRPARLSSSGRTRRVANVRVERTPETVNVYCRVVVEEQITQAHRLLASDYRGSDMPTDTPIERDAATTTEQNTVWQTIRRDKPAEQRILEAISALANPPPPVDSGADPP